MRRGPRLRHRSARDERGAAAVEFALLLVPLMLLVFGIISYGVMLTFRQNLSQAATEGARAAAVQVDASKRTTSATSAVNQSMSASGISCGTSGLTCAVSVGACSNDASAQCVTVTLTHTYRAHPRIPSVPLIDQTLPQTLRYSAVARVS